MNLDMIYVVNASEKPLPPTNRHGKVRRLLRDGKAKIIKHNPFTIQLIYNSKKSTTKVKSK